MASAWGKSWGLAFGAAFGVVVAAETPQPPSGGGDSYSEWVQKYQHPRSIEKRAEVDHQNLAMIAVQHAEDDVMLHLIMNVITQELI